MPIEIVEYSPEWPRLYEIEASSITQSLGKGWLAIHHFGSTAVAGLKASIHSNV
jgi:GrpB-like predicted nucleotidyltransferase (UPF0157 family)